MTKLRFLTADWPPTSRSRVWPPIVKSYNSDPHLFFIWSILALKTSKLEKKMTKLGILTSDWPPTSRSRDWPPRVKAYKSDLRAWKLMKVTPIYFTFGAFWLWKRQNWSKNGKVTQNSHVEVKRRSNGGHDVVGVMLEPEFTNRLWKYRLIKKIIRSLEQFKVPKSPSTKY